MSRKTKHRATDRRRQSRARGPIFTAPTWLPLALVLAGAAALHVSALGAPFFADDYLFLDQVRDRGPVAAAEYSALLMNITQGKCYTPAELGGLMVESGFTVGPYRDTVAHRGFMTAVKD